jgi:HTH-type transcriptional regulator, sugar sensing transcriptional regulator
MDTKILEEIGLTNSEIKVYLALLKIGQSTKKDIVKESQITPSKLYEITDKLIEKGMISYIKKNKVLHFSASPPEQVIDFINLKKQDLDKQTKEFEKMIPDLKSLKKDSETNIEVLTGWKGMRTAYKTMLNTLGKNETDHVIVATPGEDKRKVEMFFQKLHLERREKQIHLKMIINKEDKKWAREILNNKKYDHIKFIEQSSPAEINFYKDTVMIVLLTKIPSITIIKNKFLADSYKTYFDTLWKTAKS